ncbi:hypothetical protein SM22010_12380, partial [Xanthomonas hortorum pv. gardneri]
AANQQTSRSAVVRRGLVLVAALSITGMAVAQIVERSAAAAESCSAIRDQWHSRARRGAP